MPRRHGFDIPARLEIAPNRWVSVTNYRWDHAETTLALDVELDLPENGADIIDTLDWRAVVAAIDTKGATIRRVDPQAITPIRTRIWIRL